jgi:hypothetical protein
MSPFTASQSTTALSHNLHEQGHTAISAVFRGALYQGACKIEDPLTIDLTRSTYSRSGQEIRLFCGL